MGSDGRGNWAICYHHPVGRPGLTHLAVFIGFLRAGKKSKPQRVSTF